jgi:hypothetical protein
MPGGAISVRYLIKCRMQQQQQRIPPEDTAHLGFFAAVMQLSARRPI